MKKQWFLNSLAALGFMGVLSAQTPRTALPGTVNYVEGQVSINGSALSPTRMGNAALGPNQILSTGNGKAEVLLSPGVFLRTGSNSQIRMVSPELVDPRVEVIQGEAMIEVDFKPKDSRINVMERGADVAILKEGLYRFDSAASRIGVIDGKLQVTENGTTKELGRGKEVTLNGAPLKTVSFDRKAEDDLYRWSSVRSAYLAEANESTAQYVSGGYGPFWGTGWYWNPYFASWSWLPGDGFFYSPFGYPFSSPRYVVYAPHFGGYGFRGGYRGGFGGRGIALAPRTAGFARGGGGGFHGGGGGRR